MSYRHESRAGNAGDVHKHVCLLSVINTVLQKYDPPPVNSSESHLLYIETHSGSGHYDETSDKAEERGVGRVLARDSDGGSTAPEIRAYAEAVRSYRRSSSKDNDQSRKRAYPGSPLLAVGRLRPGDTAVLAEMQPDVAEDLSQSVDVVAITAGVDVRVEVADGYDVLRRGLVPPTDAAAGGGDDPKPPPAHAAAVVLIDPPYVDTSKELDLAAKATVDCVRQCNDSVAGVQIVVWYPIKDRQEDLIRPWRESLVQALAESSPCQSSTGDGADGDNSGIICRRGRVLFGEIWTKPRGDYSSEGGGCSLAGSGVAVINPPNGMEERMREWMSELHGILDPDGGGSWSTVLM